MPAKAGREEEPMAAMNEAGARGRGVIGLAVLAAVAVACAALAACETVKGVGKDVQNAGEAGERAINK
jgi:predicted small secreted protein